MENLWLVLIPFVGTTLGASLVFFLKKDLNPKVQKILIGFAAGVMIAASIWSLIIPAIEQSSNSGNLAWLPAAIGFTLGMLFLLLFDSLLPHQHLDAETPEGIKTHLPKSKLLFFSVTLHNIPEGLAVGAVLTGILSNQAIGLAAALSLVIGIAIQNFPEGAIISMPMYNAGTTKPQSFFYGVISGIVEPLAAILMFFLVNQLNFLLPYFLSFAAGAMIYVVVEELIPETQSGKHNNLATIGLMIGFVLMMILDVALG